MPTVPSPASCHLEGGSRAALLTLNSALGSYLLTPRDGCGFTVGQGTARHPQGTGRPPPRTRTRPKQQQHCGREPWSRGSLSSGSRVPGQAPWLLRALAPQQAGVPAERAVTTPLSNYSVTGRCPRHQGPFLVASATTGGPRRSRRSRRGLRKTFRFHGRPCVYRLTLLGEEPPAFVSPPAQSLLLFGGFSCSFRFNKIFLWI